MEIKVDPSPVAPPDEEANTVQETLSNGEPLSSTTEQEKVEHVEAATQEDSVAISVDKKTTDETVNEEAVTTEEAIHRRVSADDPKEDESVVKEADDLPESKDETPKEIDGTESRSESSISSSDREPQSVGHVTVSCVKHKVECSKCSTDSSLFWRTGNDGGLLCVACVHSANAPTETANSNGTANREMISKEDPEEDVSQGGSDSPATPMGSVDNEEGDEGVEADEARGTKQPSPRKREVRKGTRMKTAKSVKSLVKGRRTVMFKRQVPAKTVPSVAHFITTPYVRHKGSYLQSGDIVSMLGDDGEIYYAQLRSFLVDQFGQLSATISWLIPSERSPTDGSFDAASFVIGPEEDFPRELASMSFECHAPSEYYLSRSRPVLFDERKACKAFTWTTLGQPKAIWDDRAAEGKHYLQQT